MARAQAFKALAARYRDDDDAQIFTALYVAGTQSQADQTYAAYLKPAAILKRQFAKHPDHPGVAHRLIHSCDAPPIADKGLPAARRYATLASDATHALHMPSRMFTQVGAWQDAASTAARPSSRRKTTTEIGCPMRLTTWFMHSCSSDANRQHDRCLTSSRVR